MIINRKTLIALIEKCLQNSRELSEEAKILKTHNRLARSFTLFHLSNEEIGKVFLILKFILRDDYNEEEIKKIKRELREHKLKIDYSRNIDFIVHYVSTQEINSEILNSLTYTREQITKLNNLKNISLYAYIDKEYAIKPSEILDSKEFIQDTEDMNELRLTATEQFCSVFLEEINNLIQIVKDRK
ncbi:AbiV family abortive infection protein [Zunongwangia sp. H14]|uniref:AbiV family abortive infection protein n=1 Tax=Zunongwangia sp. H14 TaxID=3240792 RepID=UPI0035629ACE